MVADKARYPRAFGKGAHSIEDAPDSPLALAKWFKTCDVEQFRSGCAAAILWVVKTGMEIDEPVGMGDLGRMLAAMRGRYEKIAGGRP